MNENAISIVTAFFDIGRGNLPKEKNGRIIPAYQQRTTDTYFEYFNNLSKIDNELIVYTTADLKDKVLSIREKHGKLHKTHVVCLESFLPDEYTEYKMRIEKVMQSSLFVSMVHNPELIEYWNSDYVLVNMLKSYYVNESIKNNLVSNDVVAWIDFGYCRDANTVPFDNEWVYPFDKDKVHFFLNQELDFSRKIEDIIATGDVYIQGCHIVAGKDKWSYLLDSMVRNMEFLIARNLIDDDQTLLLMSYLDNPSMFVLRENSPTDWFRVFKDYQEEK